MDVELDGNNNAAAVTVRSLNAGGGFGGSSEVSNGTAAETITTNAEISGGTYSSSSGDENALRIDGASVTLDGITIDKTGGELIGAALGRYVHWFEGSQFRIDDLCISPAHQGRGAGSELLRFIREYCRENGIEHITLKTNRTSAAYRFYIKTASRKCRTMCTLK